MYQLREKFRIFFIHPRVMPKTVMASEYVVRSSADVSSSKAGNPVPDASCEKPLRKSAEQPAPVDVPIPVRIRRVVEAHWDLRFNVLDNNVELRPSGCPDAEFVAMDERRHNSVVMKVQEIIPLCYRSWVDCYLYSETVRKFHPLRHYVESLPVWDGRDYVGELALRVSTNRLWGTVFRHWMRAMVSGWTSDASDYANQMAPLLVSERQGMGKSTFCRRLLPPALRAYYTDKFDLTSDAHSEKLLSHFALINMDEFDRYSERQMGVLKNLLQLQSVKLRQPRSRALTEQPRVASFIGTSNFADLLTDPSGARRFFCLQVDRVIDNSPVSYDQLYAQVVAELKSGAPTYFTKAEEQEIERHNRFFYRDSPLNDAFFRSFSVPSDPTTPEVVWLTAAEIFETMKQTSGRALQGVNIVRLGKQFRLWGVPKRRIAQGNLYGVVRL